MRPSGAFTKALEITDSGERASFLEEVSKSGSPELAEEVSSLLLALENSDPLLEHSFFVPEEVKRERKKEKFHDFPERFGEYALLEVIGRGGMGVIYKASQDRLERVGALKMIKEANLATRDDIVRFYAEAKAAASLNHPGIVPVYEAGCIGEQHYFTMGLVVFPSDNGFRLS